VLAWASIETLIVGLWCLHNDRAVRELDAASIKALRDMLTFLSREEIFPGQASFLLERVLNECLAGLGQPAAAPSYLAMARQVDKATGGSGALSLYDRYYRPTSTLAVHATAAALTRHVRSERQMSLPGTAARGQDDHWPTSPIPVSASWPTTSLATARKQACLPPTPAGI
jgi:hypothetical protein